MNCLELQTAVRDRCGLISGDQAASGDVLRRLVNAALHRLETAVPNGWPWLRRTLMFDTVADVEEYPFSTLPAGVEPPIAKVVELRLPAPGGVDLWPLTRVSKHELDALYPTITPSWPQAFAVDGEAIWLRPIPNAVLTAALAYVATEADLVDDADEPLLPARFHDAVVEQAALIYFRRINEDARARDAGNELDVWLRQMRSSARPYVGAGHVRASDR